jgi:branched-chain amino acid transport system permease protein
MIAFIPKIIFDGILIGGIYALVAMGFTLQYGVARVLNLAHGEFIMFAGFSTLSLYVLFGINPLLALVIVALGLGIVGFLLHTTLFRKLLKSSPSWAAFESSSLLAAFGLLFMIQATAKIIWPGLPWRITFLAYPINILGVQLLANQVIVFSFAIAIALAFYFFLVRSRVGKAIRAAGEDPATAGLMGINTDRVLALCFGLGAGLAGLAGVLYSTCYSVTTDMGLNYTLIAMVVVVLGGLGSVPGAFIGGLILGLVSEIFNWTQALFAVPAFYFIFIILLLVRPTGIMGKR